MRLLLLTLLYATLLLYSTEKCAAAPPEPSAPPGPSLVEVLPSNILTEIIQRIQTTKDQTSWAFASRENLQAVPNPMLKKMFINACKEGLVSPFLPIRERIRSDTETLNNGYIAAVRAGNFRAVRTLLDQFGVDPNADDTTFLYRYFATRDVRPYDAEVPVSLEELPLFRAVSHSAQRHTGMTFYEEDFKKELRQIGDSEENYSNWKRPKILLGLEMQWRFTYKDALIHSCGLKKTEMVKALLVADIVDSKMIEECHFRGCYRRDIMLPALLQHPKADAHEFLQRAILWNWLSSLEIILKSDKVDFKDRSRHAIYDAANEFYVYKDKYGPATLQALSKCEKANPVESLKRAINDSSYPAIFDIVCESFPPTSYSKDDQQELVNYAALELKDPSKNLYAFLKRLKISSLHNAIDLLQNAVKYLAELRDVDVTEVRQAEVKGLLAMMKTCLENKKDASPPNLEDFLRWTHVGRIREKRKHIEIS